LVAEERAVLLLVGVSQNALHLLVDEHELLGLFGQLLLHLIRAQEQVFQVSPVALDFSGDSKDLSDV